MEYQERLVIHSIKFPFAEDNMNTVIIFLVNKYNYLLKTMINSIPANVDIYELVYEPVNDMVKNILLSRLFPYIKSCNPDIDMKDLILSSFKKYICNISVDLFNKKKDISSKNITFHETDLIAKFKGMFSMNESYWDIPVKSFLKNNGILLGKISSYVYDRHWDKNINERNNKSLSNKIDKSCKTLTKNFSSFFAYGGYIDIEDTYDMISQFISNYSKLYSLYYELSKHIENNDIIMIIISKANILDD
jgi:hypothetical protein